MSEHANGSLSERVERLEREVEELRSELRHALQSHHAPAERRAGAPGTEPVETRSVTPSPNTVSRSGPLEQDPPAPGRSFSMPFDLGNLSSGEWWLNKIGISLLLFGIAFLFMFSVERGWISPPMRVGFGLAIGAALLTIGFRVYENRRAFSQVLLGGGIGAFYITGFAAFQLYDLVSYPVAFAFMVAVTLLAYFLSLRQDQAPLSIIGALGGLGTPFLLYTDTGTLGRLVLYTCLILAGMAAVYFYKGWTSLLAVSSTGGWLVFFIGYVSDFIWVTPSLGDRWALQLGVTFAWLLFWIVPVAREVLHASRRGQAHLYIVSTPVLALTFTAAIWTLSSSDFGWITLSAAALYALVALGLRYFGSNLSYTHTLVALLLLTYTFILKLDGNVLLFTLAAEAAVLHYVARRFLDRIVSIVAHLLFLAVALWLAARLLPGAPTNLLGSAHPPLFNVHAFVDLVVIALAFAASGFVLPRNLDWVYRVAAHAALLAWLWRELSMLPGGDAWVTVAWGLYAVGLLVAGLRLDRTSLVKGGMVTLFLVVGKLFLVDLAQVEAIWRVFLFLGFGSLFLALSYYLHSLWRPGSGEGPARYSGAPRARS